MRYRFLKEHRGELGPIRKACKTLRVSKSGFYEFLGRRKSNAQIEREVLEGFVAEVFEEHRHRYSNRRINKELRKNGIVVSDKRVPNVMRKLGLRGKGATRKWRPHRQYQPGGPGSTSSSRCSRCPRGTGSGLGTSPTYPQARAGSTLRP